MRIAVVTGASAGLGAEFARQLDREDNVDRLWLIARRGERLADTAAALTKPCDIVVLDLLSDAAADRLAAKLQPDDTVTWLINNAGMGILGPFSEQSASDLRQQIRLNDEVPIVLTNRFDRHFAAGSRIVNVASVAGFAPQPGFAVYAASKAMLIAWSRALGEEYRGRGIGVTVCCPNPMETEFFRASERRGQKPSRLKRIGVETPARVVRAAVAGAKKGKPVSVTHPLAKAIRLAAKLLPVSVLFWFMRLSGIAKSD